MKRSSIPAVLALAVLLAPSSTLAIVKGTPVAAVSDPASPTPSTAPATVSSNLPTPTPKPAVVAAAKQAEHLATLKTKGTAEISRRVTSLNAAVIALNATTKLSSADKTTLLTQVQSEITGLNTLSTKLSAETTLAGTRTDVQSIFDGFRVYALMLPKARLVATADQFAATGEQFDVLAHALEAKIATAKAAKKDVTSAQTVLTDMEAKLNDARGKYTGIAAKVIALDPADYNANHAVLAADRDGLVQAKADFVSARSDATTILSDLSKAPAASATPATP